MKWLTRGLALAVIGLCGALASQPAVAQEKPLKFVMSSTPSFTWLPFLVARATQFEALQRELGRTIDVTYSPTTTPAILGLIAGDYDFGIAYVQHAIKAQAEGKDLVVLAAMMDNPTAALVVRSDLPEIKTPADLKGKTLGVVGLGSGHHMIGLAIAEAYGLRADDITIRSTGGISGWIPAMRAKRIDALIASEPTLSRLLEENLGRILVDLHGRAETHKVFSGPHPTVAVIARRDYIAANPKVVQAVVGAHLKALQWIAQHKPNEIADALPDELKKQAGVDKILARVLPAVSTKGETTSEAVTVTANWLKRMGEIPADAAIDPKKVVDDKFLK